MKKELLTLPELIAATEAEMVRSGYSAGRMRRMRGCWRRFAEYAVEHHQANLTEEFSAKYLREKYNYPFEYEGVLKDSVSCNVRGLDMLHQYQQHGLILRKKVGAKPPPPEPFGEMLQRFAEFSRKNGYGEQNINRNKYNFCRFAEYCVLHGIMSCSEIVPAHITGYLNVLSGYTRGAICEYLYALRRVFKYMYLDGYNELDLSLAVPRVVKQNHTKIAPVWEKDDVQKLIDTIDRGHPCGKRDFAIMLLVSKLGLSDCDIRNLKFENIHWDSGILSIVQSKTLQTLELPLPEDVGWAIIDYLKHGRPESSLPYIFLRHIVPYEPLVRCYDIIKRCIARAGIEVEKGKARGLHSFRHTLASRLLEQKVPLETISSVLGHKSAEATNYYLHVDLASLRKCALDPEGVTANG